MSFSRFDSVMPFLSHSIIQSAVHPKGSVKIGELCDTLRAIFNSIEAKAIALDTTGTQCQTLSGASGLCVNGTSAQPLIDGSNLLRSNTIQTLDLVQGLGPTVGEVGDLFKDTIPYLIDWGIGLVTAFIALTVFFGLWTVACGSTFRQKLMIAFSVTVLTVLCPLIAFELTLSVVLADFCVGLQDGGITLLKRQTFVALCHSFLLVLFTPHFL
jgi:hypothetical protein